MVFARRRILIRRAEARRSWVRAEQKSAYASALKKSWQKIARTFLVLSKARPYERSEENGGVDSACFARVARRIGGSKSSMKLVIVTILGA